MMPGMGEEIWAITMATGEGKGMPKLAKWHDNSFLVTRDICLAWPHAESVVYAQLHSASQIYYVDRRFVDSIAWNATL